MSQINLFYQLPSSKVLRLQALDVPVCIEDALKNGSSSYKSSTFSECKLSPDEATLSPDSTLNVVNINIPGPSPGSCKKNTGHKSWLHMKFQPLSIILNYEGLAVHTQPITCRSYYFMYKNQLRLNGGDEAIMPSLLSSSHLSCAILQFNPQ